MKELYISPKVELDEFDLKDIIITSPGDDPGTGSNVSEEDGWTGLI